ncbi:MULTISPECIES: glutathione S-transferase [Spirulina sp. CCY15215]|uniref:glutathione S-transferase family protein n=1 Tax=Spirulina sp. CCY15215 TaxID=2767591 RepID=UPI00194DD476|nr:glutathione S-transferase [Spirulina major]
MLKLYSHELSGNSYKVRLMLSVLGLEHEVIRVDLMSGEHKKPAFLTINPFGQVPVLVDGETVIQDAQAILTYLARRYGGEDWFPSDAIASSQIVRWLSTTAGEVRQGPENARLYHLFGVKSINIDRATEKAKYILTLLNKYLETRSWLEFERPTVADIAVFPYIALAADGKISLEEYPHIIAWIERVKKLPGFVGTIGIDAPQLQPA